MIKINIEDLEKTLNNHIEKVQNYINYDALQNRERIYIKKNIEYILKAKPDEFEDVILKVRKIMVEVLAIQNFLQKVQLDTTLMT